MINVMKSYIIIPTYKRQDFIQDMLESLRAQNVPKNDFEILIVDNAPYATAEIRTLCRSLLDDLVYYIHEPQIGLHNARHAGARAAKGEILIYIDDDVFCPPGWLAAMLETYNDPLVAMAGGKVVLQFEIAPSAWVTGFGILFSEIDLGDTPRSFERFKSPFGCNMSIRRSVLFDVGGFNPDGFGDPALMHYRGDGEIGLARKVHNAGLKVWYAPDAWLKHRIPVRRMTPAYVLFRSAMGGIEDAYVDLRYHRRTVPGLFFQFVRSLVYWTYYNLQFRLHRADESKYLSYKAAAIRSLSRAKQHWRQALSPNLRSYTVRSRYNF